MYYGSMEVLHHLVVNLLDCLPTMEKCEKSHDLHLYSAHTHTHKHTQFSCTLFVRGEDHAGIFHLQHNVNV